MFIRSYSLKDGRNVQFSMSLPSPASDDEDSEWQVELNLTGLSLPFQQTVYGVDAIQALELALMILRTAEEKEGLKLPDD